MARLTARIRDGRGKGAARKLRATGEVPAVSYGQGGEARPLSVRTLELEQLLSRINPENTIIDLTVDGGESIQALIREVQQHPSKRQILHVDFFEIQAGEKITVGIPVQLHGTPKGVSDEGGVLQEILRELSVECLPKDIPTSIDLDVSGLGLNESLHVSDVKLEKATILNDPELVVCTVSPPTVEAAPEEAEAEEGAAEAEGAGEAPSDQG